MPAHTDTHSDVAAPTTLPLGVPGSAAGQSSAPLPRRARAAVMMLTLGSLQAVVPGAMSGQSAAAGAAASGQGTHVHVLDHKPRSERRRCGERLSMIASARLSGDREWIQFFDPTDTQVDTGTYRSVPNKPMYYGDGAYYVAKRGVDTLTVVSVTHKKYFDLPGVVRASSMMGGLLTLQLTAPTITVSRIQPDTMVEDVQTHHWRIIDDHTNEDVGSWNLYHAKGAFHDGLLLRRGAGRGLQSLLPGSASTGLIGVEGIRRPNAGRARPDG